MPELGIGRKAFACEAAITYRRVSAQFHKSLHKALERDAGENGVCSIPSYIHKAVCSTTVFVAGTIMETGTEERRVVLVALRKRLGAAQGGWTPHCNHYAAALRLHAGA